MSQSVLTATLVQSILSDKSAFGRSPKVRHSPQALKGYYASAGVDLIVPRIEVDEDLRTVERRAITLGQGYLLETPRDIRRQCALDDHPDLDLSVVSVAPSPRTSRRPVARRDHETAE